VKAVDHGFVAHVINCPQMLWISLAITIRFIDDYNQIHWFSDSSDAQVNVKIQNSSATDNQAMGSTKAISDLALDKVVGQFSAALKDTQDFIKKSFEQIVDAPTTDMDTSRPTVNKPNISHHSTGRSAINAVDEYVERECHKLNVIIHNLPELTDASSSDQMKQKDREKIGSLISSEFKIDTSELYAWVLLMFVTSGIQ